MLEPLCCNNALLGLQRADIQVTYVYQGLKESGGLRFGVKALFSQPRQMPMEAQNSATDKGPCSLLAAFVQYR